MHSASTDSLTYYQVDTNRAGEAFDRVGILPGFQGVAVHDALPSYLKRDVQHALCNAHLLRELTALEEQTKQRKPPFEGGWPTQLKATLLNMKDEVAQAVARGEERLPDDTLARLEAEYDRLVKGALRSNPSPERQPGQKGRARASPARNGPSKGHFRPSSEYNHVAPLDGASLYITPSTHDLQARCCTDNPD